MAKTPARLEARLAQLALYGPLEERYGVSRGLGDGGRHPAARIGHAAYSQCSSRNTSSTSSAPRPLGRDTSLTVHVPATLLPWTMAASSVRPVPAGWSDAVATTPVSSVVTATRVAPSNATSSLAAPPSWRPFLRRTPIPALTIVLSMAGLSNSAGVVLKVRAFEKSTALPASRSVWPIGTAAITRRPA